MSGFDIGWDRAHRSRTEQRNTGNDILDVLRLQLPHKVFHPATFQLKNAIGFCRRNQGKYLGIGKVNFVHIQSNPSFGNLLNGVLNHRQSAQSQKVHCQKPQLFQRSHRKLRGQNAGIGIERHIVIHRTVANHHAGSMRRSVSGKSLQSLGCVNQPANGHIRGIQLA